MTINEVLALKPGSKLDLLITEKVMGWITPWEPFFSRPPTYPLHGKLCGK